MLPRDPHRHCRCRGCKPRSGYRRATLSRATSRHAPGGPSRHPLDHCSRAKLRLDSQPAHRRAHRQRRPTRHAVRSSGPFLRSSPKSCANHADNIGDEQGSCCRAWVEPNETRSDESTPEAMPHKLENDDENRASDLRGSPGCCPRHCLTDPGRVGHDAIPAGADQRVRLRLNHR